MRPVTSFALLASLGLLGCPAAPIDESPGTQPPPGPPVGNQTLGVCGDGELVTVATVENRHGEVRAAHVGTSGMVGIASEDRSLKFWDAATGELAGSVEGFIYQPAFSVDSDLTALNVDGSGQRAVSGESSGRVAVWQVADSELVHDFGQVSADGLGITSVAFSPISREIVTSDESFGGSVAVRDPSTGSALDAGQGRLWGVEHLSYSPDGNSIAITGDIYGSPSVDIISSAFTTVSMALWEGMDLQLQHNRIDARVARWTPDGNRLVVVGDRFAAVLDVSAASPDARIEEPETLVLFDDHDPVDVAVSPDGEWFVTVGAEGDLRVHDLAGEQLASIGLGEPVAIGLDEGGTRLAAVHLDGTVELLGCAE